MKRAKVSSVYEGRGKRRSREEEQGDSKIARMNAKARKYGYRNGRPRTPERTIITRSMASRSDLVVEEGNQEMGKVVLVEVEVEVEKGNDQEMGKVVELEVEVEKGNDQEMGKVVVVVEKGNDQEMGKVVEVEKGNDQEMDKWGVVVEEEKRSEINVVEEKRVRGVEEKVEEGLQGLEDWPPVWSYQEEWLWLGKRWDPNWEVMTGDVWVGGEDVEMDVWEVDIWTFDI